MNSPIAQPASPDRLSCATAQFETGWPQPSTAVITAHGEIDAANKAQFVAYALQHAGDVSRLVVDLTGVKFFATAGFSALHTINVQCIGDDVRWALVASPAVDRVLRICAPDSALPIHHDLATALAAVDGEPAPLLQLVPESR